ncbi:hypothetical protein GGR21_003386 [Dysgonomonas hofstadii]|uniref:Transcription regulator BetR N-terminal domain-containing protein n=1 Tax=Dysgonomonas hofstadii TaxID=637886 RepID=A0A840CS24_9BACT|nr:hypothetical protein [Dysgonomonas hofstadii]MBB4037469.1 hypothetical protein [Dysgonomonas hofstadii]
MRTNVHEDLIETIKTSLSEKDITLTKIEKDKIVSILADILCLGKEAIYRRLRGEVRFTFEEVAKISLSLGFSIDNIIGVKSNERAIFDLNLVETDDINRNYVRRLEEYINLFKRANRRSGAKLKCAFNSLPYFFYLRYENLAKFKLFKWAYQVKKLYSLPFREMEISKEAVAAQRTFVQEARNIKSASIILNQDIFSSFIREINYFHTLNLIDEDDIQNIKSELNQLLTEMELLTISGTYNTGADILLYLSNINIDASYILLNYDVHSYAHLNLYGISGIDSQSNKVCQTHNEWIDSLKRYSILITHGGEMQRYKFFQEQRMEINSLCSFISA